MHDLSKSTGSILSLVRPSANILLVGSQRTEQHVVCNDSRMITTSMLVLRSWWVQKGKQDDHKEMCNQWHILGGVSATSFGTLARQMFLQRPPTREVSTTQQCHWLWTWLAPHLPAWSSPHEAVCNCTITLEPMEKQHLSECFCQQRKSHIPLVCGHQCLQHLNDSTRSNEKAESAENEWLDLYVVWLV